MKLGLGTAAIGRPQYLNIRKESTNTDFDLAAFRQRGRTLLDEAFASGIRYFDTAPGYGLAEQLLIDWVAGKEAKDLEIATKWGYTYLADFKPDPAQHEVKEHTLENLNRQWEQSRKLLPFLSTYQIHSATLDTGVLENRPVLERLAELKARHGLKIGITTTGANQAEVFRTAPETEVDGAPLFDAFQVTYNLLDQSLEPLLKEAVVKGKRIIIKEALANGRVFPNPDFKKYRPMYDELSRLARKYRVGVDAVVLRFCWQRINPYVVLSGASESWQLNENLKAMDFELEDRELDLLGQFKVSPEHYWTERKALPWN